MDVLSGFVFGPTQIRQVIFLVHGLVSTTWAFNFYAAFRENRLCRRVMTFRTVFYAELRKLLVAVRAIETHAAICATSV
jgi:hypothetical protein